MESVALALGHISRDEAIVEKFLESANLDDL